MSTEPDDTNQKTKSSRKWIDAAGHFLLKHTISTVSLVMLVCIALIVGQVYRLQTSLVEAQAVENARQLSLAISEFRSLYTSEVVQRLRDTPVVVTHNYQDIHNAIPLPATFSILLGNRIGQVSNRTYIKLYSPYPFPWREEQGGLRDDFGAQAWKTLKANPKTPFYRFEESNGGEVLRMASADIMRPSCVGCHNSHPDTPKSDWLVGDLRGIVEVVVPVERAFSLSRTALQETFLLMLAVTVILLGILAFAMNRWRGALTAMRALTTRTVETNRRLEKEIDARTRAENALESRANELSRSNKDLEQFAYIASHDLQEPLRKIRAFGGMLEKAVSTELEGEPKDYLDRMLNATQRMQQLINDLLTFSRATSSPMAFEKVDLTALIESVQQEMEPVIEDSKARIRLHNLPTIDANPVHMRQLFQNLISNAVKFRRDDIKPEISISAEIQETLAPGTNAAPICKITVSDNGIGFEKQFQDKIFEMFKRLHARGTYPGTGIGLAICQRIVERHHGNIQAISEPGKGTSFVITLPVHQNGQQDNVI